MYIGSMGFPWSALFGQWECSVRVFRGDGLIWGIVFRLQSRYCIRIYQFEETYTEHFSLKKQLRESFQTLSPALLNYEWGAFGLDSNKSVFGREQVTEVTICFWIRPRVLFKETTQEIPNG